MLRIFLFSIFISTVYGGYVDKFVGSYVIAAAFPDNVGPANCEQYSFAIGNTVNCECLHRKDFKLLEFGFSDASTDGEPSKPPTTMDVAMIEVTGTSNIDFALIPPKCDCGGIGYKTLVVRYIDNNFFAYYESYNQTTTMVNVFSKTKTTKASLDAAIKAVPDLKDRTYKALCVTND